ncbi:helix-turn-helix transcriptional regulator [Ralstonia flatus]|uniref:AlpA family transcriptional regulator n=1 Tax=Ralstonia flatus TaxID=3058601 RepID=A0ABN9KJJ8_9RALS|nr:AlpA family phage regulatory protein [Ralstonia sp. LMG 32965]MBN6209457.1 AlpA family phage regulatory protein [Ralstonia pickettii]CAJ0893223.1 hypothetical protein R77564_03694 [Ralstonia sp. LMG 32965]
MSKQEHAAVSRQSIPNCQGVAADASLTTRQLDKASRILRMKELVERTGLSRATIYVLIASDPMFPKKIPLTERAIGFLELDVERWIASRAEARAAT